MSTLLEHESATATLPQGASREGLIFEHSKRGRRGYRLPALDVPGDTRQLLIEPGVVLHGARAEGIESGVDGDVQLR